VPKELQHGKPSTYNNHKCRCDLCKAAWAEYMRPRVKAFRAKEAAAKAAAKEAAAKKGGVRIDL
jgi:hypothetical protein